MAKFLQDTVEEMAVAAKKKKTQEAVVEFATFFEKVYVLYTSLNKRKIEIIGHQINL